MYLSFRSNGRDFQLHWCQVALVDRALNLYSLSMKQEIRNYAGKYLKIVRAKKNDIIKGS